MCARTMHNKYFSSSKGKIIKRVFKQSFYCLLKHTEHDYAPQICFHEAVDLHYDWPLTQTLSHLLYVYMYVDLISLLIMPFFSMP